jgi:hypothetical protein
MDLPILTTTTEPMMRTRQPTTTTLENLRIPVQAKLTAAWTSLMFFVIYIDYFHLYQPGAIDQIRGGGIFEFDITPTLMTIFVVVIGIPALMILLSMTLPARANRATNLIVASVQVPLMVFNAAGESWEWASFYALSIGIEVLILAFILRSAWTWPRTAPSATMPTSPDREAVRAQQQA